MTNSSITPKRTLLVSLAVFGVGIGAGMWAYTTNAGAGIDAWLRPVTAALMIASGLLFLPQFVAFRPKDDVQRRLRIRMLSVGSAQIALGAAQLVPDGTIRLPLICLAAAVILALAFKFPRRLFA